MSQPQAMRLRIGCHCELCGHAIGGRGDPVDGGEVAASSRILCTGRRCRGHSSPGEHRKCSGVGVESAGREGVFGPHVVKAAVGRGRARADVRSRKSRVSARRVGSSRSAVHARSLIGSPVREASVREVRMDFGPSHGPGRRAHSGSRSRDRFSAGFSSERQGGKGRREATRLPARGMLRRV